MAITFESIPNDYSPSDNPLTYVFSSDETGQPNFSFKVETLLDGSVVAEDRVYVERTDRSHYDVSPNIKNLIPKPTLTSGIGEQLDSIGQISLRVTESYGDPIADQATATSSQTYTFKACLSPKEWESTDFTTYLNTKWLTDVENNIFKVIRGQDVFTALLADTNLGITINWYDINQNVLDTFVSPALPYTFIQFNFSDSNMQLIYGGVQPYSDVSYFTCQVNTSEILTILYVDDYCYDAHALVWLNKYGTYEQYPILHNVIEKTSIESRGYKKKYGQWDGTDFEYSHLNSGNIDFEKIMQDDKTLVTDYLTETTQNWFVSAYDSPEAYLYSTDGIEYRGRITGRTYEKKKGRFEDLIMEEVKFEDTNNRRSVKL